MAVMLGASGCGNHPATPKSEATKQNTERLKGLKADLAAKRYDLELQEAELAKHLENGASVARRDAAGEMVGVGPTYIPRKNTLTDRVNQAKVEVRRLEALVEMEATDGNSKEAKH